jgi:AIR carboxylase
MRAAIDVMKHFGVPHEVDIVSAHRTPGRMMEYAQVSYCTVYTTATTAHYAVFDSIEAKSIYSLYSTLCSVVYNNTVISRVLA